MNLTRRKFLKLAGSTAIWATSPSWSASSIAKSKSFRVNDIHSQLNSTSVSEIVKAPTLKKLKSLIRRAKSEKLQVAICGGRHSGGGQQFASNKILLDTTRLNSVIDFNKEQGLLEVEAGIRWPELIEYLEENQKNISTPWGITQKQTGTDYLTLGGTLGANAHGQGLVYKPIIQDIESFKLINHEGKSLDCSRNENKELFSLVIGGYGLFGVVSSLKLRLNKRPKVMRIVDRITIDQVIPWYEKSVKSGCKYGDFQASIDSASKDFLNLGVFSSYHPVEDSAPVPPKQEKLMDERWLHFVTLAHQNKGKAFEEYMEYCERFSGKVNWSDVWQRSTYIDDYHRIVDKRTNSKIHATEVLTELYVPHEHLVAFFNDVKSDFLKNDTNLMYTTIRFIEKDDQSFLPWARQKSCCVIFNLHTVHTEEGIKKSAEAFRKLISRAIKYNGTYYLTYHRYATKDQILACYPRFPQFLKKKLEYDPEERFVSDWYWHNKKLFS